MGDITLTRQVTDVNLIRQDIGVILNRALNDNVLSRSVTQNILNIHNINIVLVRGCSCSGGSASVAYQELAFADQSFIWTVDEYLATVTHNRNHMYVSVRFFDENNKEFTLVYEPISTSQFIVYSMDNLTSGNMVVI